MIKRIDVDAAIWRSIKRIAPNFDPATLSPQRMLLPAHAAGARVGWRGTAAR